MLQAAGIAPKSFTSALLEGRTLTSEENDVVRWSAVSLYGGGSDTVGPFLHILAIVSMRLTCFLRLYPQYIRSF
jgi:hypothetical protein